MGQLECRLLPWVVVEQESLAYPRLDVAARAHAAVAPVRVAPDRCIADCGRRETPEAAAVLGKRARPKEQRLPCLLGLS